MKNTQVLFLIIILTSGCINRKEKGIESFIESKPSFFELRHGSWLNNHWIRKPENLLMVHETFKKLGYKNIITYGLLFERPLVIQDIYINKSFKELSDSLIITYNQDKIRSKYYREFWQRRKSEKNDSAVYTVIREISGIVNDERESLTSLKNVNDTLYNLLRIEFFSGISSGSNATKNFLILRKLGFHQSAYNLLYERKEYETTKWNRDSLRKTLTLSNEIIYPWFEDNSK